MQTKAVKAPQNTEAVKVHSLHAPKFVQTGAPWTKATETAATKSHTGASSSSGTGNCTSTSNGHGLAALKGEIHAVYFFAGPQRKGDVRFWLQKMADELNLLLIIEEVDLLRGGKAHDLADASMQKAWLAKLDTYNVVILTHTTMQLFLTGYLGKSIWSTSSEIISLSSRFRLVERSRHCQG